jgi:uncharacterized protein (UPF0261 family)
VACIAVLGTFDSKGEEHRFLKEAIEQRGFSALTIHVGTKAPPAFPPDIDLGSIAAPGGKRDQAIAAVLAKAKDALQALYGEGKIWGVISAGGGTGTYLATSIMKVLPLGVPKVMVSTVASRDMSRTVGIHDITVIHSVADLLGVNSITGTILDMAAGAVCGMAQKRWRPSQGRKRVALTLFGFIAQGGEAVKACLEELGYEVIAFHANGTGGMAMEALAAAGHLDGILDLALHEMADRMFDGYCGGIGPQRLEPVAQRRVPRLVVPGGLDCAVLEFTRDTIPEQYRERKTFFYDFRSGIRLNQAESIRLAEEVAEKLNRYQEPVRVMIPLGGWSEADAPGRPLYDPEASAAFVGALRDLLEPWVPIEEVEHHINDRAFARHAARRMHEMITGGR